MKRKQQTRRSSRRVPGRSAAGGISRASQRFTGTAWTSNPALNHALLRCILCGTVFVSLIALKLMLPGNLSALRGTMRTWLVRDADFTEAFSAVGHAVSGAENVLDSLSQAYIAVFGHQDEAAEVSASAEGILEQGRGTDAAGENGAPTQSTDILDERELPAHVSANQHVLGIASSAPLEGGTLTSDFGWREHPTTHRESFHYGIDLAAEEGSEIRCFADGVVGAVGESTELGKYLTVTHDNGISTLYAHCSRITVSPDSTVKRGDKIAETGSTGNTTGPHLHFEIHDGDEYLNPIYYLS